MSTLFEPRAATEIAFIVYGKPVPQGSSRAFIPPGWHRAVITSDNKKLKPWRQEVAETALTFMAIHKFARHVPLEIWLDFYFRRPPSVPKSRLRPTVKPDGDKLERSIFDSLTGILFHDDAQIVSQHAAKWYGDPERVEVRLAEVR